MYRRNSFLHQGKAANIAAKINPIHITYSYE
jgi:hypothetical protein